MFIKYKLTLDQCKVNLVSGNWKENLVKKHF
jgi:hypothetical protein